MRNIVVIMGLLLMSACGTPPVKGIEFSDAVFPYTNPSVTPVGKRLIYLHGIGGSHNDLSAFPEYRTVIDILIDAGWQVITIDLPIPYSQMFDDGGDVSYRAKYVAKLEQTIKWSEDNVGHCTVNVIGGISFGGLHALMGAALNSDITGYFADVPVTLVETLPAKFSPAPSFSPFGELSALETKIGYVDYGGLDMATNWHLAESLIQIMKDAGADVTGFAYPHMAHAVHDLTPNANWVLSRF